MSSKRKQGPVERVLRKARGLIAKGWCKSALMRSTPSGGHLYCAVGAVNAVACKNAFGTGPEREPALNALRAEVPLYESLVDFNNSQETSEPVLALFDRAIATAKERGL